MTFCKIISFCFGITLLTSSCNFFEDEFIQDKKLAYYRYHMHKISDSIPTTIGRVNAYKSIIENASTDTHLITPRKKNMLLSEVYNTMSGEYFESKNIDDAIGSSTLAVVLNTSNQHAYYNRACIYQAIGKDSLAILDYTKALLYNDHYTDSYYNRGIIYERQTDFQLAIEDYSDAINLSPSYIVDVYNNRGNVYQEMRFFEKAIADYDKALELDSTNTITYCNRADAYTKIGEYEKAMIDYNKAAASDSLNFVVVDKISKLKKDKKVNKLAIAE